MVIFMSLADAIRNRIKNLLNENNMNLWKLYKKTGIPMPTLSAFMSGKRQLLTLTTLLHICEGFNIKLSEFFEDSIFDEVIDD